MLDFVNEPQEVLEAFQTYYETASLEDVTDPHLVYQLRSNWIRLASTTALKWIGWPR